MLDKNEPTPMYDPAQGTIRLDVEVKDSSGNPVTGLNQQDFAIRDNGQPRPIVTFQPVDGMTKRPVPPVEVILVIDELNMRDGVPLQALEDGAERFLRQNQGHLAQPVSVYLITKDGPWTGSYSRTDGNALAEEVAQQNAAHRIWKKSTSVHGNRFPIRRSVNFEVDSSLDLLGAIAIEERRRPGRKMLFWLGPGWQIDRPAEDGLGQNSIELCIRMREARIAVWQATEWPLRDDQGRPRLPTSDRPAPISGQDREGATGDGRALTLPDIARQSGGGVLRAPLDPFRLITKKIGEGSSFYFLTFDAPRTAQVDDYHQLKVEVGKSSMAIRTRAGYFDEPVFYDQAAPGVVPTTVAQLEDALLASRGTSDRELSRQLSRMELTERLNSARLRTLESALPGKRARQALIALADQSVFLAPPAAEILPKPAPDPAAQEKMLLRAIAYVAQTIPRLPNFLAERITVQYGEAAPEPGTTWKTVTGDTALNMRGTTKAAMRVQNGREVVEEEGAPPKPRMADTLKTSGVFGPVLGTVLLGAIRTHGDLTWIRWDMGTDGPEAVFRYRTTREKNLYFTGFDSITIEDQTVESRGYEPFHGELAIDPESGAILRLTLEGDLEPRLPLDRSDIMVEYAPQLLGGRTYICPARSVSISRQRAIMDMHRWTERYQVYGPFETLLNDVVFDKYHLFHPTVRMLPGYRPVPAG